MIKTHRSSTTVAVIVCLLAAPSSGILFASDEASSSEAVSTISSPAVSRDEPLPGTTEFVRSLVADSPHVLRDDTLSARSLAFAPQESSVFAQRGYRRRGSQGRNNGAVAAMVVGAAAAIAGTAVLVYANRPECSALPTAGGCGYGTRVVGGSVLSAGVAGLLIGALTWR